MPVAPGGRRVSIVHFHVDVTDQCGARLVVVRPDTEWCYEGTRGVVIEGACEGVVCCMWDAECEASSSWICV